MNIKVNTIVWLYSGIASGWWCYDEQSMIKLSKMYINYCFKNSIDCSDFVTIDTKANCEMTNDLVDFNFTKSDKNDVVINNIIKTSHGDYEIDFDRMIQFNSNDISKKRGIKYIIIPDNITNDKQKIKKYLFDSGIKGISGTIFKTDK